VHNYNSLHIGLVILHVDGRDGRDTSNSFFQGYIDNNNYDNLPQTLKIFRFKDVNITNKINSFPDSLNEIAFDRYSHPIDNIPASVKYIYLQSKHIGPITFVPYGLIYFSAGDSDQEYNIMVPFSNNLKYFMFKGTISVEQINALPDSIETLFINQEFDETVEIKYPKNLNSLYLEEYAIVNFNAIPEGVDLLQVGDTFIDRIIPEKLPSTLKEFIFLDNIMFQEMGSDYETDWEDDTPNEDEDEDTHLERPRKNRKLESKRQILIDYLNEKGIQISQND